MSELLLLIFTVLMLAWIIVVSRRDALLLKHAHEKAMKALDKRLLDSSEIEQIKEELKDLQQRVSAITVKVGFKL